MRFIFAGFVVGCSWLIACGGEATTGGSGGAATTSSTSTSQSTSTSATGGSGGGTTSVGAGGQGGGSVVCGGLVGGTCDASEYCDFPGNFCGGDDGTGICTPRPEGCNDDVDLTCGCDGVVHTNPCEAASAGTYVSNLGGCMLEPGTFACGSKMCSLAGEYCLHQISDTDFPDTYICKPYVNCPVAMPTCACTTAETQACGGTCDTPMSGGVVVHCPGG